MAAEDKHWATHAVIDPLNEPQPSTLDGPGTHFYQSPTSTGSPKPGSSATTEFSSNNPFRRNAGSVSSNGTGPSGPARHGSFEKTNGASTHARELSSGHRPRASSDMRKEAVVNESSISGHHRAGSNPHGNAFNSRQASVEMHNRPRRSSSLRQRYPGDTSDQPLDMLRKDTKLAHRSPHLRKHHQPRPDTVDVLDKSGPGYHHEGPFDAALLVRNSSYTSSPVAALKDSNAEALKATPQEKVQDSLHDHRPLDGTAFVPPGHRDQFGNLYEYEEGTDWMREPGSMNAGYKRWPGIQYDPNDLKGKGEPSYTIEKNLKEHKEHQKRHSGAGNEIELAERPKPTAEPGVASTSGQTYGEWERDHRRTSSGHAHKLSDGIKRRVGSLRRKDN